jgi:hypothetical protein
MKPTIHKKYCCTCKTADESVLHKKSKKERDGHILQYYSCRACTTKRIKAYYHSLDPVRKKKFSLVANKWNKKQASFPKGTEHARK